jgi:hypothetical protein
VASAFKGFRPFFFTIYPSLLSQRQRLEKFSEYARILGYEDYERFGPDDLKEFKIAHGWIVDYYLVESPVLPHGADRKLLEAKYILDNERYIPPEIKEAISEALYWKIMEFRPNLASPSVR